MAISKITADSIGALEITHAKLHTDMDLSAKTITLPASVRGPATLTLDPATVGDNTGTVVIAGSLTVNGTTTTVNSNTVNIGDNLLVLNSDETGTPSQNSGIEIDLFFFRYASVVVFISLYTCLCRIKELSKINISSSEFKKEMTIFKSFDLAFIKALISCTDGIENDLSKQNFTTSIFISLS